MNDDKVSKTKETDLQKFVRSLLDPEGFGHTVSAEVRDKARHALGIPKSENTRSSTIKEITKEAKS